MVKCCKTLTVVVGLVCASVCLKLMDHRCMAETISNRDGIGLARPIEDRDNIEKYVQHLERELEVARTSGDGLGEINILTQIGQVYGSIGRHDEALRHFTAALTESRRRSDLRCEMLSLRNIARVWGKRGPLEKALDFYEELLALQKRAGDHDGQAATLDSLASVYRVLEQPLRELQCHEEALKIRGKTRDLKGETCTLNSMATTYDSLREPERAENLLQTALRIQQQIGDAQGTVLTLNNMALRKLGQGHYVKASELCERATRIGEETRDSGVKVIPLRTKALIAERLGQYEEAVRSCNKAISTSREIGDRESEMEGLNVLGRIYASQSDSRNALESYEKVMQLATRIGDHIAEIQCLERVAETYAGDRQLMKAAEYYEKALARRTVLDLPLESLKEAMAIVYLGIGDTGKARGFMRDTSTFDSDRTLYVHGDSDKGGMFIVTGNKRSKNLAQARLDLLKGDLRHALHTLNTAEAVNIEEQFASKALHGLVCEGLGRYGDATESFKSAVEMIELIRETLPQSQRTMLFDVDVLGVPRLTPYEGLCRVYLKMNNLYESFKYAEMTKARSFADSLVGKALVEPYQPPNNGGYKLGTPASVWKEDEEINQKFLELMLIQGNKKHGLDLADQQLGAISWERERHISKLREMYPLFAATRYPQPMSLGETDLKDNEWVIEYEVTDNGIIIFLIRGKTIVKAFFKSVSRKQLNEDVRKFREPLDIDPTKDLLPYKLEALDLDLGKRLSDLLIGEVLPVLPADVPVIVVPDECLGLLPFEMLVLNSGGRIDITNCRIPCTSGVSFFGDRNPITYFQSITSMTLLRLLGNRNASASRILAYVDPIFENSDDRFKRTARADEAKSAENGCDYQSLHLAAASERMTLHRLKVTGELGTFLKQHYPGLSDVLDGEKATKNSLLSTDLTPYRNIVFATHGYASMDLPGVHEPVLMMTLTDQPEGTDGFLRMSEIMRLRMNSDLVALTACQTGVGRHVSGEGTLFLGRAFQFAGAESVLISLWNVAAEPSVLLMKRFFEHRKSGKGKLESLRMARAEIRKSGYDHPFFWAAFILVGAPD